MCRCNECKHRFGGREMKREELKYFYATDGEVGTMPLLHNCFVYPKEDVDHLLDEKDAEIAELKAMAEEREKEIEFMRSNCKWYAGDECARLHGELMAAVGDVGELKAEIESLKASHYAEIVDAGMRERRLRRALWLARANNAINSYDKWNLFANFESEDKLFTIDEYDETPGVTDFSTLRTYAEWCKVWQNVGRKCLKKAELYK